MQIVIGLLCDQAGIPLSIEVFAGNTSDPKTAASQVKKNSRLFWRRIRELVQIRVGELTSEEAKGKALRTKWKSKVNPQLSLIMIRVTNSHLPPRYQSPET
jgi:hypothetical protein